MAYKRKASPTVERSAAAEIGQTQAKAPVFIPGEELEYRIARLLLFMGFFVRRACPIYTVAALDRATDLDVLALKYREPFSREMIIAECKSGATGPLDRIFWLSGVKQYSRADRAMLVRKGTKWNIKDFAKDCGVEVLDLHRVSELETNFKITGSEWPGPSDFGFFRNRVDDWNSTLKKHPELWELQLTLSSEVRYDDPFPSINFLLYQLRLISRTWKANASSSLHRYLLGEAVSQLAVFLMRIAERTFDLTEADRRGYVEKGLKYGNVDPKFAERMLNSAFNLTRQAVLHYTNKVQDIDPQVFQVPLPPGTTEVLGIIQLILRHYPKSLNLPQICDLLLTEVFVKENRNKGWLRRIYQYPDPGIRVEIVREYLRFLGQASACPEEAIASLAMPGLDNDQKSADQPISTGEDPEARQAALKLETGGTARPDSSTGSVPDAGEGLFPKSVAEK